MEFYEELKTLLEKHGKDKEAGIRSHELAGFIVTCMEAYLVASEDQSYPPEYYEPLPEPPKSDFSDANDHLPW